MIDVVSVKTFKESYRNALKNENPAWLTLKVAKGLYSAYDYAGKKTLVICGGGGNGACGLALSLLLNEKGVDVTVLITKSGLSQDGVYFFNKVKKFEVKHQTYNAEFEFDGYDVIVDAMLGTGFSGKINSETRQIITRVNLTNAFVIAVDLPSGLDGDSGLGKTCVKACLTVCISQLKSGCLLGDGIDACGKLKVIDLGEPVDADFKLLEKKDVKSIFAQRKRNTNKSTFGYVAIIGGSRQYAGAIKLANMAISSLKVGAGLVRLGVPKCIWQSVSPYMQESTLFVLSDKGGQIKFKQKEFDKLLEKTKSVAIGVGLGMGKESVNAVKYLLANYTGRLVIDADGLNALAKIGVYSLLSKKCEVVLTPHLKEFSVLSGVMIDDIIKSPIEYAKEFAKKYKVTLLLKGASTIVTDGERVFLSDRGCSGMATAGSGDCLTGIIAGINAFSEEDVTFNAVCSAFIGGLSGEIASQKTNEYSLTASDTAKNVAIAVTDILKSE